VGFIFEFKKGAFFLNRAGIKGMSFFYKKIISGS